MTSAMRRQREEFAYVQKHLQTARLNSNCIQANFPVLSCIGVLLVYQHTARDIAGQEVEGRKEEVTAPLLIYRFFFGPQ